MNHDYPPYDQYHLQQYPVMMPVDNTYEIVMELSQKSKEQLEIMNEQHLQQIEHLEAELEHQEHIGTMIEAARFVQATIEQDFEEYQEQVVGVQPPEMVEEEDVEQKLAHFHVFKPLKTTSKLSSQLRAALAADSPLSAGPSSSNPDAPGTSTEARDPFARQAGKNPNYAWSTSEPGEARTPNDSDSEDEQIINPLPVVPDRCGPPTIPLSVLLDFAVQHVYHEITVLAELMQRKSNDQTDQEKKKSLLNFAHATRTQFIKLVALVKWIRVSKRMDVCYSIDYLLDLQSQYYIDTADRLVAMTRGDLQLARLPEYHVVPAVDVLTLGTYNKMPTKIKDAFVPPAKITPREQQLLLTRLNQNIESRISKLAPTLTSKYDIIEIRNGMAVLTVPGEFEIKLTLLGEGEALKWTLLNIKILVEDYELGLGAPLVHALQLNQLHGVLQTRMDVAKNPLNEACAYLHSMCISLQLDVLFCQTSRLAGGRLRDNIIVEKYDPKERLLIVGYWVKRSKTKKMTVGQIKHEPQYRVQIYEDKDDKDAGLKVRHYPQGTNLGTIDSRTGMLSMDRLLSETFIVRCRERLMRLRRIMEMAEPSVVVHLTGVAMPSLTMQLLPDSTSIDESLIITVNSFCGKVLCSVHKLDDDQDVLELGVALQSNSSANIIRKYLQRLRVSLVIERYRRSVKALPVKERKEAEVTPLLHKHLAGMTEKRIIFQFIRSECYYLIITFTPNEAEVVNIKMMLLQNQEERCQLIQLDNQYELFGREVREAVARGTLNLKQVCSKSQLDSREQRLAFAVAEVEDRITYMFIAFELEKRGIKAEVLRDDEHVPGGLALHLVNIDKVVPFDVSEFYKCCVRSCLRIDNRFKYTFQFEMCFENIPLVRDVPHGLPHRREGGKNAPSGKETTWVQEIIPIQGPQVMAKPEHMVENIIHRLNRYLYMYKVVHSFSLSYSKFFHKFCSIEAYTFHKLVVSYGPTRDMLMILAFNVRSQMPDSKEDRFLMNFGQTMPHCEYNSSSIDWHKKPRWNPHALFSQLYRDMLKETNDLVLITHYLLQTIQPLQAIGNFSRIRFQAQKSMAQMLNIDPVYPYRLRYHLIIIDKTTLRLLIGPTIIEFRMLEEKRVAIRDVSRWRPRCPGMLRFFQLIDPIDTLKQNEPEIPPTANEKLVGPPIFVPEPGVEVEEERGIEDLEKMVVSTAPVLVTHDCLTKACNFDQVDLDGNAICPFDDYLNGIAYLTRAVVALERMTQRAANQKMTETLLGIITLVNVTQSYIKFRGNALNGEGPQTTEMVNFTIYMCPKDMVMKCHIVFDESIKGPTPENIEIISRYFEKVVARTGDEFSLQSFVTLVRVTANNATNSIAKLMQTQLEQTKESPILLHLSLTNLSNNNTKLSPGVRIDQAQKNVMVSVFLSQSTNPIDSLPIRLVFKSSDNSISVPDHAHVGFDFKEVQTEANDFGTKTGESPIWAFVKGVMDRVVTGKWKLNEMVSPPIKHTERERQQLAQQHQHQQQQYQHQQQQQYQQQLQHQQQMQLHQQQQQYLAQQQQQQQRHHGPGSHQMNMDHLQQQQQQQVQQQLGHPASVGPSSVGHPASVGPGSVGPGSVGPGSVGIGYPGSVHMQHMTPGGGMHHHYQ